MSPAFMKEIKERITARKKKFSIAIERAIKDLDNPDFTPLGRRNAIIARGRVAK